MSGIFMRQILRPYLVTVILEMLTAWILRVRAKEDCQTVFLVNTITNPALNLLLFLLGLYAPSAFSRGALPVMEVLIVIAEGFLFRSYIKKLQHPFLFSLILNAVSFFAGGVLLKFF
ncbi:MAG: hypothetical protein MJ116_05495 [Lachnospiraceae bacterium]|nr:hypothetical protein [Lachnospiraceae bacterium]